MKIKVRLQLTFGVFVVALMAISLLMYLFFLEVNNAKKDGERLVEFSRNIFELNLLTNDYILHNGDNTREQWELKHRSLLDEIIKISWIENTEIKPMMNSINNEYLKIKQTFREFSDTVVNTGYNYNRNIPKHYRDALSTELITAVQEISATAYLMHMTIEKMLSRRLITVQVMSFIFIMIMFMLSVIGIIVSEKSIGSPLAKLASAVRKITSGNLGEKFDPILLKLNDEVGFLAMDFEKMRKKLKLSRENLEKKIRQRTRNLLEEKAKDDAILQNIGDGLVVVNKSGEIILANKVACDLIGICKEKKANQSWNDYLRIFDENDKSIHVKKHPLHKALKNRKKYVDNSHRMKKIDNTKFNAYIVATPVLLEKEMIGAVMVFRDITMEKNIDKAKTEFVSLASHQLRTPLSTMNWYAEMLLDGDAGKLKPTQQNHVVEIYNSSHRMAKLVNSLLNVSRLELGTFTIDPETANIVDIANDAINELMPKIKEKRIKFKVKLNDKIKPSKLDKKLIHIIFQNLLSNAIKYTGIRGNVSLSINQDEKEILITVKDDGIGIPKKQYGKMFTKLFRADNARKSDADGTGLGLYIIKSILSNCCGKIWFESKEGKGSTFFVSLPSQGMVAKKGTKKLT
ncbi:MAG: ATP-binding protein [bacterium]